MYGFERDNYISFTPQGYYVSSKKNEELAAWRIRNKVYTFNQYSPKFNKPDLLIKILADEYSPKSDFNFTQKTPPELYW